MAPSYQDNFNSYRKLAKSGRDLPNPRLVSTTISDPRLRLETNASMLLPMFGQFLAHDMTGQSATTGKKTHSHLTIKNISSKFSFWFQHVDASGYEVSCECGSTDPSCMPVQWPANDITSPLQCMKFTRSSASFSGLDCSQSEILYF